jgi:hypothetical protein
MSCPGARSDVSSTHREARGSSLCWSGRRSGLCVMRGVANCIARRQGGLDGVELADERLPRRAVANAGVSLSRPKLMAALPFASLPAGQKFGSERTRRRRVVDVEAIGLLLYPADDRLARPGKSRRAPEGSAPHPSDPSGLEVRLDFRPERLRIEIGTEVLIKGVVGARAALGATGGETLLQLSIGQ